jgi:hypothetical protein
MTPAGQAQQTDLFRSKHRGRARKHRQRRIADGDGEDPTGRRGAAEDGQSRYVSPGICAGRRAAPIRGPRISSIRECDAMVPDRRRSSIFGAADHPLDAELCTPCSHPVADYI